MHIHFFSLVVARVKLHIRFNCIKTNTTTKQFAYVYLCSFRCVCVCVCLLWWNWWINRKGIFHMKFSICSITVILEYMNGPKNNRAIFYPHFTLVMYLLTFLAALLPKDMVANGHSHWASYQQPFSQYLHHWPLKLVRSNASRQQNRFFKLNWWKLRT